MLFDQTVSQPSDVLADMLLHGVRPNIVQSIRAFHVTDLQSAAQTLGQRFLYADLCDVQSKQDALDLIGRQFGLTTQIGKSFGSLYDSMTGPIHKSGVQSGFIAVLEHLPANAKFDREAREQLLDIFRDIADYWSDRKVPFRCFYSFCVARAANPGHVEQANKIKDGAAKANDNCVDSGEKMPTDKLLDISPQALRMSSPFNPHYWTSN